MPRKRAATASIQEQVKMMKMGIETVEDIDPVEEKYRISEDMYPSIESEPIGFEGEEVQSPGMRTDTISLLMKIDQLQSELKYERRCRILAERELKQMKEMNDLMTQMRHTAHDLRTVLDHARQSSGDVPQGSGEESITYITEPVDLAVEEDDDTYLHLPGGLRVKRILYERVSEITDFKKYISALLMVLFDRETLATHTLQGRRCNINKEDTQKPPLNPDVLRSVQEHVKIKFGVDSSVIRSAIRTKLNNEDKLFKKRLGYR